MRTALSLPSSFARASVRAPCPPAIASHSLPEQIVTKRVQFRGIQRKIRLRVTQAIADGQGYESSTKSGLHQIQIQISSLWDRVPEPVQKFPWNKATIEFVHRFAHLFWIATKWLSIPLLFVSCLGEVSYVLLHHKELLFISGLISGSIMAGILIDAAVRIMVDLQVTDFPWHLLVIGLFFTLVKLPGPLYPLGLCAFLPGFANGGLWRLVMFEIRRRKRVAKMMSLASKESLKEDG